MKQCVFDAGRWRINQQSSKELDEEAQGGPLGRAQLGAHRRLLWDDQLATADYRKETPLWQKEVENRKSPWRGC